METRWILSRVRLRGHFRYFIWISFFMFVWIKINNIEIEEEIVITEDLYWSCDKSSSQKV